MTSQRFFEIISNRHFQMCAILFSIIYISIIMIILSEVSTPNEQISQVQQVTKKMKQFATVVKTGLHIDNFPRFSFDKNEFIIDAVIWFMFPIGTESLDTIQHFSIDNSLIQRSGTLIYKSAPNIKLIGDDVVVAFDIQTMFKAQIDHKEFPIGDHRLNIIIYNKYASPYELIFASDKEDFTFAKTAHMSDWEKKERYVRTGYGKTLFHETNSDLELSYPAAVFSIDFENVGFQEVMSLYFPMFVIFFIGIASLVVHINDSTRLTFIGSSVPILVLFRMVIDGVAPQVGYTTHVDTIFYFLVMISLLILVFQTYVTLSMRSIEQETAAAQKRIRNQIIDQNSIVLLISLGAIILFMTHNAIGIFAY